MCSSDLKATSHQWNFLCKQKVDDIGQLYFCWNFLYVLIAGKMWNKPVYLQHLNEHNKLLTLFMQSKNQKSNYHKSYEIVQVIKEYFFYSLKIGALIISSMVYNLIKVFERPDVTRGLPTASTIFLYQRSRLAGSNVLYIMGLVCIPIDVKQSNYCTVRFFQTKAYWHSW